MHILACRLPKQEEARGYVSKDGELWVERGIQRVKRNVKYRTTEHPEKLFAHDLMADMALARMRHSDEAAGTTPPPPPKLVSRLRSLASTTLSSMREAYE